MPATLLKKRLWHSIFAKISILDVEQGSEYATAL